MAERTVDVEIEFNNNYKVGDLKKPVNFKVCAKVPVSKINGAHSKAKQIVEKIDPNIITKTTTEQLKDLWVLFHDEIGASLVHIVLQKGYIGYKYNGN